MGAPLQCGQVTRLRASRIYTVGGRSGGGKLRLVGWGNAGIGRSARTPTNCGKLLEGTSIALWLLQPCRPGQDSPRGLQCGHASVDALAIAAIAFIAAWSAGAFGPQPSANPKTP